MFFGEVQGRLFTHCGLTENAGIGAALPRTHYVFQAGGDPKLDSEVSFINAYGNIMKGCARSGLHTDKAMLQPVPTWEHNGPQGPVQSSRVRERCFK